MTTRNFALFAALVMMMLSLVGCGEDKLTMENYNTIQPGMTLAQAEMALGGEGEKQQSGGVSISGAGIGSGANANISVYVWKGKGKEVSVTIKDGKVLSKGHSGL